MELTADQEKILQVWKALEGRKIPPCPNISGGSGLPIQSETKVLTGHKIGSSNNKDHLTEEFFIPPAILKGQISEVTVGENRFKYDRPYSNSEVWYGQDEGGDIRVVTAAAVYLAGRDVQTSKTNAPWHHYNPASWDGRGSSIVLCSNAPKMAKVTIAGKNCTKHGNLDKGRVIWTVRRTPKLEGQIVLTARNGQIWKFQVHNNDMQYNDCD